MKNTLSNRLITIKRWTAEQMATRIGLGIAVFLVIIGGVLAVLFQSSLRESQDTRQQASVAGGDVDIHLVPSASPFMYGQPGSIDIQINTHGVQTDGVQLVFNLITPPLQDPLIQILPGSGLNEAYLEMEQTNDGYLVGLIAVPSQIGGTFSSNSLVTFARLTFSPPMSGIMVFAPDQANSLSTVHNTNPPQDELNTLAQREFSFIHGDPSPSPTISPTAPPSPSPSATPIATATPVPTSTPVPSGTPVPTATPNPTGTPVPTSTPAPSATPNYILDDLFFPALNDQNAVFWFYEVGTRTGVSSSELVPGRNYTVELPYAIQNTYKTGNTTNGNVTVTLYQNNYAVGSVVIPYASIRGNSTGARGTLSATFTAQVNNTFRFTIDPSNNWGENNEGNNSFERTYSYYTGQGGVSYRSCNESCNANSECGPNFRCYQNRCRLVTNVSSENCSSAITYVTQTNPQIPAACNVDCSANAQCAVNYRCYSGKCRLATNPTSATCTPGNVSTVSTLYSTPTKGGLGQSSDDATNSAATPKPVATMRPSATVSPMGSVNASPTPAPTALNDITSWFGRMFGSNDASGQANWLTFPTAIMIAGSILLLLIILTIIARMLGGRRSNSGTLVTPNRPLNATYERSLQQRISELQTTKTENKPVTSVAPPSTSAPATPVVPRAATPGHVASSSPMTPPPSTLQTGTPGSNTPASMIDRIKQKGVTTPGQE